MHDANIGSLLSFFIRKKNSCLHPEVFFVSSAFNHSVTCDCNVFVINVSDSAAVYFDLMITELVLNPPCANLGVFNFTYCPVLILISTSPHYCNLSSVIY